MGDTIYSWLIHLRDLLKSRDIMINVNRFIDEMTLKRLIGAADDYRIKEMSAYSRKIDEIFRILLEDASQQTVDKVKVILRRMGRGDILRKAQETLERSGVDSPDGGGAISVPAKETSDPSEKYRMTSLPRGQAMIINIKEFNDPKQNRKGSEFDRRDMKKLLEKKLHFTVTVKDDLKLEEMKKNLDEFSKRPEHKHGDCCVVVIMSHGYQGSGSDPKTSSPFVIYCSDGKMLEVEWIIQKFNTVESLKGKPKVFIIQACRAKGSQSFEQIFGDIGNPGRFATDANKLGGVTVPTDTFVAISTTPYNVSYRDEEEGTLFIQAICSVFEQFGGEMDFISLMRKVHDEVDKLAEEGNAEQSPELSIRGKNKVLYFNP